eukprot:11898196-Prorocentrum_lima.AAC.1
MLTWAFATSAISGMRPHALAADTTIVKEEPVPVLTLALDQCTIGRSGSWYLSAMHHVSMFLLPDPSHGSHNDLRGAVKHTQDLWLTVLLCTPAFNSLYGPWRGTGFWGQLCEGAEAFLAMATEERRRHSMRALPEVAGRAGHCQQVPSLMWVVLVGQCFWQLPWNHAGGLHRPLNPSWLAAHGHEKAEGCRLSMARAICRLIWRLSRIGPSSLWTWSSTQWSAG